MKILSNIWKWLTGGQTGTRPSNDWEIFFFTPDNEPRTDIVQAFTAEEALTVFNNTQQRGIRVVGAVRISYVEAEFI